MFHLSTAQGISGKHIKFDAKTESYVLDPALKLNSTVRDAVLCVCELGWLYGRVAAYLKGVLAAGGDSLGVVVQAFGFALQVNGEYNARFYLCSFCKS